NPQQPCVGLQLPAQVAPIHVGKIDIEQDQVGKSLLQRVKAVASRRGAGCLEACVLQDSESDLA
ncbi:MAG TPA: hypothetical protein VK961_22355, partial [Chthoniobacter sp.]|nr:hypothetical protein [Chthoniobacter sp.]